MYTELAPDEQAEAINANLVTATGPTALGACIFGGGFSFGMEEAGFDVAGHLELPDLALGTNVSRQRWPVLNAGLEHWLATAASFDVKPDVIYANPPCVAYAGTGKHGGTLDQRMCYTRYCSYGLAMEVQPKVWCWELVPGIFGKERGFLDAMAFRASRLGYECHAFLTSSALHGGFQDRRRFHFVASKVKLDFQGVYDGLSEDWKGVRTLGDCLEGIGGARLTNVHPSDDGDHGLTEEEQRWGPLGIYPNDSDIYHGAFKDIMPYCPPGSHLRDVPDVLMYEHYRPRGKAWTGSGLPGFSHTRARLDRPSPNILGGHTLIHPVLDRYLTPREGATIMGFPISYAFSVGAKAYAEIGRGLCTHNARFLGTVIRKGLEDDRGVIPTSPWLNVVDWRPRAKQSRVKMSAEAQKEWFADRHPDVAVPEGLGMRVR